MALEQKLSIKLSQRLVMTPKLQQALKLLQVPTLELEQCRRDPPGALDSSKQIGWIASLVSLAAMIVKPVSLTPEKSAHTPLAYSLIRSTSSSSGRRPCRRRREERSSFSQRPCHRAGRACSRGRSRHRDTEDGLALSAGERRVNEGGFGVLGEAPGEGLEDFAARLPRRLRPGSWHMRYCW